MNKVIIPRDIKTPNGDDFVMLLKHIQEIKDVLGTVETLKDIPIFENGDFSKYISNVINPLVQRIAALEKALSDYKIILTAFEKEKEELKTSLITNTTNDSRIENIVNTLHDYVVKFIEEFKNKECNFNSAIKTISEKEPTVIHEVKYANAQDTVILRDSIFTLPAKDIKHIVGNGKILISKDGEQVPSVVYLHGTFDIHGRKMTNGYLINDGSGFKWNKGE